MSNIRASIAMASYNGEKYIKEQILSILQMMAENDEIIISDDHSSDDTINIINSLKQRDSRIKLFTNPGKGLGQNFEHALRCSSGKYIFYADQDDVWINDKINHCIKVLDDYGTSLVVHDGYYTDSKLSKGKALEFGYTLFGENKMPTSPFKIFIKTPGAALGCCMAFKRESLKVLLPLPNNDHDVWTLNLLSKMGGITYIYEKLILHRMHGNNVSKPNHRNLIIVIISRLLLAFRLYSRILRTCLHKNNLFNKTYI